MLVSRLLVYARVLSVSGIDESSMIFIPVAFIHKIQLCHNSYFIIKLKCRKMCNHR